MKNKITVKDFVKGYENCVSSIKNRYIEEKLEVLDYLPVNRKSAIAITIVDRTMYKQEKYVKDNGEESVRKTDDLYINSFNQYMLFCKVIIEEYTNLVFEDVNFMNEYDLLKKSRLLDKLMVGSDKAPSLIPLSEISEIKTILDMRKSDVMTNYYDPHAYVSRQVERFGRLTNALIEPFINVVKEKMNEISQEDINKVIEFAKKADFKEV